MVVNHLIIGEGIKEKAHQRSAKQYIDGLEADVAPDDLLAATGDVVGHTEHLLHHILADEHAEGNDNT